tara:strand:+ start:132 stop:392 length:261 start_codon:yes stop_codon:yes gene_type:complete
MRAITIGGILATLAISGAAMAQSNQKGYGSPTYGTGSNPNSNSVDGYTKNNGTYVQPHTRTNPDNSKSNNYGAPGNNNPNKPFGTK